MIQMNNIRNQTSIAYKNFWIEYDDSVKEIKDNNNELSNLFNLYFFIINKSKEIYNSSCKCYLNILSILSIFSLFLVEMNNYLTKNMNLSLKESGEYLNEIIDNSYIINQINDKDIEKILDDNESSLIVIEDTNIKVKENILKLYLKLRPLL